MIYANVAGTGPYHPMIYIDGKMWVGKKSYVSETEAQGRADAILFVLRTNIEEMLTRNDFIQRTAIDMAKGEYGAKPTE